MPLKDEVIVNGIYDADKIVGVTPASIDILSAEALDTISLVHPAEAFNRVAGVNIHRGSGQEHLTAIREVFKGPGPAFYGSNAVHGLINVQSADIGALNKFRIMGSNDGLISAQIVWSLVC